MPLLANHFLRLAAAEEGKELEGFTPRALQMLEEHDYPGNVRELQNIVSRAVVVSTGGKISAREIPRGMSQRTPSRFVRNLSEPGEARSDDTLATVFANLFPEEDALPTLEAVELELIRHALVVHGGKRAHAAKSLGISRATLYRRLGQLAEENSDDAGTAERNPVG